MSMQRRRNDAEMENKSQEGRIDKTRKERYSSGQRPHYSESNVIGEPARPSPKPRDLSTLLSTTGYPIGASGLRVLY